MPQIFIIWLLYLVMEIILSLHYCHFTFAQGNKGNNPAPNNSYNLPNASPKATNVFACWVNGVNYISDNDI